MNYEIGVGFRMLNLSLEAKILRLVYISEQKLIVKEFRE